MLSDAKIQEVLACFDFGGAIKSYKYPFGEGHINDTIRVFISTAQDENTSYIVQKINKAVFKKPEEVMHNMVAVTEYLIQVISSEGGDPSRETLTVCKTKTAEYFYCDEQNEYWRAYRFVPDSICLQKVEKDEDFATAAESFGHFMLQLNDFPADSLYETIPKFHNTVMRLEQLKEQISLDPQDRIRTCQEEIAFALSREDEASILLDMYERKEIPLRVTHNDTKLNNILIDEKTGKGICIIDLDTVMPGLAAYDFGDAIRFGAATALEDEKDPSKMHFDLHLFEVYAKSYLQAVGSTHTKKEIESLAWGARLITYTVGVRFLTDYIAGDVYFHTAYPEHNLVRARNQFILVKEMEEQWEEMLAILEKIYTNIQ